jgi:hypothetical protein
MNTVCFPWQHNKTKSTPVLSVAAPPAPPAWTQTELPPDHPAVICSQTIQAMDGFFEEVADLAADRGFLSAADFDKRVASADKLRFGRLHRASDDTKLRLQTKLRELCPYSERHIEAWDRCRGRLQSILDESGEWRLAGELCRTAYGIINNRLKLWDRSREFERKALDDAYRSAFIEDGGNPAEWEAYPGRHLNCSRVHRLLDWISGDNLREHLEFCLQYKNESPEYYETLLDPIEKKPIPDDDDPGADDNCNVDPVSTGRSETSVEDLRRYVAVMKCEIDRMTGLDADEAPAPAAGITDDLLEVPGLMQVYMDHCLRVAHTPNRALAFCGGLALWSFLAARKFTDEQGSRSNIYLIAMAYSSSGKDTPRKVNAEVLLRAGFGDCLGDRFGSAQGLEDALARNPQQLFQVDEIDSLLQAIAMGRDALQLEKADFLLRVFSAANSVLPRRALAGSESRGMIENPSLTLFGTAVPDNVMQAITEKMIVGGLLGRSFLLDCNRPRFKQRAVSVPVPDEIVNAAKWLREFSPGGDLGGITGARPYVVPYTDDATAIFDKFTRLETDRYNAASDAGHKAVWGRAGELAAKLAMLYAVSVDYRKPVVGEAAATWATAFQLRQVERMLAMLDECECKTSFSADADKVLRLISRQPDRVMEHSKCLKRSGSSAREFGSIIGTLLDRGDITRFEVPTKGRPKIFYRAV